MSLDFIPVKTEPPWGKAALVEIPVEFWSDDWLAGMRSKTYLGTICSHHEGGTCLQPTNHQGIETKCIPIDVDAVKITVLKGKSSDYDHG